MRSSLVILQIFLKYPFYDLSSILPMTDILEKVYIMCQNPDGAHPTPASPPTAQGSLPTSPVAATTARSTLRPWAPSVTPPAVKQHSDAPSTPAAPTTTRARAWVDSASQLSTGPTPAGPRLAPSSQPPTHTTTSSQEIFAQKASKSWETFSVRIIQVDNSVEYSAARL